jgi:hypothetical protein
MAKRAVSLTNVLPTIRAMSEYERYERGPMSNGFDECVNEASLERDQSWEHIRGCWRWDDNERY